VRTNASVASICLRSRTPPPPRLHTLTPSHTLICTRGYAQGVVGLSDIIIKPGLINVDFADVQSIMGSSGLALMGIGTAEGKGRARDAAVAALSSPLIDFPISQATGIVFTITGASDMTLQEVNEAAEAIYEMSHPDANIIFGAQIDESMGSVLSITVVATGFNDAW
jgi:cell division protein FtsZ